LARGKVLEKIKKNQKSRKNSKNQKENQKSLKQSKKSLTKLKKSKNLVHNSTLPLGNWSGSFTAYVLYGCLLIKPSHL